MEEKAQVPIWNQTDADLRPCSGSSHLRPVGSWLSVLQYHILKSHLKCVGPEAFNILDIFIFMNFCIHNETSLGLDPIIRQTAFCCACALSCCVHAVTETSHESMCRILNSVSHVHIQSLGSQSTSDLGFSDQELEAICSHFPIQ